MNKNSYNKAYNLKAKEFKDAMPDEIRKDYAELLSNVLKFKGLVDKLKKRYSDCLEKIRKGEKGFIINREVWTNIRSCNHTQTSLSNNTEGLQISIG